MPKSERDLLDKAVQATAKLLEQPVTDTSLTTEAQRQRERAQRAEAEAEALRDAVKRA